MTIDLFPTIARLIAAELPKHPIDGLDVWPVISGRGRPANPHDAYWCYYEANQLQAIMSGDGRWKLQLPHTYRTLGERQGRADGTPIAYQQRKLEKTELYDLVNDVGEKTDVTARYPEIVKRLEAEAEKARSELGDALTGRRGAGTREPGRLTNPAE